MKTFRLRVACALLALLLLVVPVLVPAAAAGESWHPRELLWGRLDECAEAFEPGALAPRARLLREFVDPRAPDLHVLVESYCAIEESSTASGLPTDCSSTEYARSAHRWDSTYSGVVDASGSGLAAPDVLAAFNAGGRVWQDVVEAPVFGGFTSGGRGASAGVRDGVNQVGFGDLGSTSVVGRTTTWFTSAGVALESDAVYNTRYAWSTTGASGAMDLQGVAAHEIGHTLGLSHPSTASANGCLTMYYATSTGDTSRRSLGAGDVLGIQSMYGARAAPEPAPEPAPVGEPLQATFRPKPGNQWWVELTVSADAPLQSVTASVDGGAPRALSLRSWGAWAASFHVPAGSLVSFEAKATDGRVATSDTSYVWPSAEPFAASFAPKPGNQWWVEVGVTANARLVGVSASVNGGTPVPLSLRSWGAWAASFHVQQEARIRFIAHGVDGSALASGEYLWPSAAPVEQPPAFEASFRKGGANAWWVEVWVDANADLRGVSASVDGASPVALERKSWGSWARSFYVPVGASVRFTAESAEGRSATSAPFVWP